MVELINLNVYPAHNIICVWNENNEDWPFMSGIALDDAERGFMIPRYIIVDIDAAKAFVRFEVGQGTEETDVKNIVLSELEESGVEIGEEAEKYLSNN